MKENFMANISRRDLLKTSAAATAVTALGVAPAIAKNASANEELRVAVIGTGGRGGAHIQGFHAAKGARLVALCDADQTVVDQRVSMMAKKYNTKLDGYTDYRKLLERDDIDVVTIAAPNHWHSLMTIHACQAGKHVYSEKPVCHTIYEGRKMVEAMNKYNRIVAAGFQNRSDVGMLEAIPMIHEKQFGKILHARGLCYRNRKTIGKRDTPLPIPKNVDYDLWLGPAEDQPIMRPKLHYDWHWDFNTGNGDMGNQGPHEMDLLRWAIGDPGHPNRIVSFGGRFAWDDAGDTPNMQCAMFDFGTDFPVMFEVRNLYQKGEDAKVGMYPHSPGVGIHITMEKAIFRGGRGGGAFYDHDGKMIGSRLKGDSGKTHMQNFVDAVLTNDPGSLRSKLESAFYSSSMSHLANISYQTGVAKTEEEIREYLHRHETATECLDRFSKQLDVWKVDRSKTPWHLGGELEFDGKKERFTDTKVAEKANALLHRKDRKPHVVPDVV